MYLLYLEELNSGGFEGGNAVPGLQTTAILSPLLLESLQEALQLSLRHYLGKCLTNTEEILSLSRPAS